MVSLSFNAILRFALICSQSKHLKDARLKRELYPASILTVFHSNFKAKGTRETKHTKLLGQNGNSKIKHCVKVFRQNFWPY